MSFNPVSSNISSSWYFRLRTPSDWSYSGFYDDPTDSADDEVTLWTCGCWHQGVQNCTTMCRNPDQIWGVGYIFDDNVTSTVSNCAAYNLFAAALDDPDFDFRGLDAPLVAAQLGILSARQAGESLLNSINETINSCMKDFCTGNDTCGQPGGIYKPIGGQYIPDYQSICYSESISINPDIGGIGVLIAYYTAAITLLAIFLFARVMPILIRDLPQMFAFSSERTWQHLNTKRKQMVVAYSSNTAISLLINSLVDFQKGQCIFWIAIDVAVLLALDGSLETLSAEKLASLTANLTILQLLCVCGFVFVVFAQYCLQTAFKRSWYVHGLSLLSLVMSATAFHKTLGVNDWQVLSTYDTRLPGCGYYKPTTFCGIYDVSTDDDQPGTSSGVAKTFSTYTKSAGPFYTAALLIPSICMLGLLGDMIVHNTKLRHHLHHYWNLYLFRPRALQVIITFTRNLFDIFFPIIVGLLLNRLTRIVNFILFDGQGYSWGFGQILALTVWLPVYMEFIYAFFRGFINASEHHIPDNYQVIARVNPGVVKTSTSNMMLARNTLRGPTSGSSSPHPDKSGMVTLLP